MVHARAVIKLRPHPAFRAALNRLDEFSHIWIIFVFHKNSAREWQPVIDPPSLTATKEVGVFASRSPHRPNPIGMSAVKLESIDWEAKGGIELHVSGVDLLDGTPVLDIKPYLPYADRIEEATPGWTTEIEKYGVSFSEQSAKTLEGKPALRALIEEMLSWDPRPTSQRRSLPLSDKRTEGRAFAFRVEDVDVHWEVKNGAPLVISIS